MLGNSICTAKVTPLLLSLLGMVDDKVPHNQNPVAAANPLWKDIPMVATVVTV